MTISVEWQYTEATSLVIQDDGRGELGEKMTPVEVLNAFKFNL